MKIRTLFASLLLCASLFLCGATASAESVTITDNPGGMLDDWAYFAQTLAASHVPVRFQGNCVSACTFLLSLPKSQICVEPTAAFGFHSPYAGDTGELAPKEVVSAIVHRWYPPAIQEWIKTHPLVRQARYLYASDLIKMGVADACPTDNH